MSDSPDGSCAAAARSGSLASAAVSAQYLGIDPSFIRLAFGLLGLFGGFGLVAYIAASIVIPLAPREDAEPAGSAPGLQGITIGLLLACAVLAAYLLATPNTMTVGTGILLAPAVIAIGAALVRPARLTRKGALVILGLALTTLLTIANFNPAFGDRIEQPTSPVELTHGYSNAFGTMTLDLTGLNFGQGHLRVRANTVFGKLVVHVPPDTEIRRDGNTLIPSADEQRIIDLNVTSLFGSVEVIR